MSDALCPRCGLCHAAMNIEIRGRVLYRRARASHRLRMGGGAFGFSARLLDAHRDEFTAIQIRDLDSGQVFFADRTVIDQAERKTLSLEHGPQLIIPIAAMGCSRTMPSAMPHPANTVQPSEVSPECEPAPRRLEFGHPELARPSRRQRVRW